MKSIVLSPRSCPHFLLLILYLISFSIIIASLELIQLLFINYEESYSGLERKNDFSAKLTTFQ